MMTSFPWSTEDKRMETDLKQFKYDASQILGLHHDDSTRTSPFSNFLSHLDGQLVVHYTLQQLLDMGFEISAGVSTPWTPSEDQIFKQVSLCSCEPTTASSSVITPPFFESLGNYDCAPAHARTLIVPGGVQE